MGDGLDGRVQKGSGRAVRVQVNDVPLLLLLAVIVVVAVGGATPIVGGTAGIVQTSVASAVWMRMPGGRRVCVVVVVTVMDQVLRETVVPQIVASALVGGRIQIVDGNVSDTIPEHSFQ